MLIYFNGLILGFSLIMALGPQNIFLIKQSARKNHALLSAIVCFICDVILATASIAGLHRLIALHPALQVWLIWSGSAFLLYYAAKALKNAFYKKNQTSSKPPNPHSKVQIILLALGFSILNPHSIIDTLIIIGSGSSQFPGNELMFLSGVITASFLWFSSLTFTAHYFSNTLSKANIWQSIELLSGLLMAYIGFKLILSGF